MPSLPESLKILADRFDPSAFDPPSGGARVRLIVTGDGQWDLLARPDGARPTAAAARAVPDAILTADGDTWDRIARDLRGGMDAYRAGRLVIRRNLHLGVGVLAATSGMTGPERLRFQGVETASGRLSILAAGASEPVILIHGLGATKGSFLPSVAALAGSFREPPSRRS